MAPITFSFRYFKGFDHAELTLAEPVTMLIGRNGAGKSNLLEGIGLLGDLACGKRILDIDELRVRGGLSGCPSLGEGWFVLECLLGALRYRIVVRPEVQQVEAERLLLGDSLLFEGEQVNFKHRTILVQMADAEPKILSSERSVLSLFPQPLGAKAAVPDEVEALKRRLQGIRVLSPSPDAIRGYQRVGLSLGPRALAADAANLSPLLYDLSVGTEADRQALAAIVKEVQALPEEPFGELGFLRTPTDEVMLGFWPSGTSPGADGAPPLHAGLLSDGTLRYMGLVTALMTAPVGTLLLIEDFDAGLHASRLTRLCELLWQQCAARGIAAVVTTHSPAALNGLSREQLGNVVVCYRERATQRGRLCPLLKIPDAELFLEQGLLGDVVTRQVLERHLVPGFPEARKKALADWLESLP